MPSAGHKKDGMRELERGLGKLVKAGELKREGSGKGTYYIRLK